MELVYQQNSSQCLAAVASMVLGIPLEEVCAFCGHDGSEAIFPELGPQGTRGFHPQEIVVLALAHGYAMTEIEPSPNAYYPGIAGDRETNTPGVSGGVWLIPGFDSDRFVSRIRESKVGIFIGQTEKGGFHAVAFDGVSGQVFDPKGKIYPVERIVEEGMACIYHYFRIDKIATTGSGLEYPV